MRFLILVCALGFLTQGCLDKVDSSEVDRNEISGNYDVSYNAQSEKLSFEVEFRAGSRIVKLEDPDTITVNGEPLQPIGYYGSSYRLERFVPKRDLDEEYMFVWRHDYSSFVNDIELARSVRIRNPRQRFINKHQDFRLELRGAPLAVDEHFVVTLTPDSQAVRDVLTVNTSFGNEVVFSRHSLSSLPNGRVVIRAKRVKRFMQTPEGHESAGGRMSSSYTSKDIEVVLSD